MTFLTRSYSTAALAALAFILAAGCASSGPRGPGGAYGGGAGGGPRAGASAGVNQPSALLTRARNLQAREGCAKAAPSYRVVAGFGAGYEVAQYELGACLFEMVGASDVETRLFRQEGMFWLARAAYAGEARAQGKLAEALSGAPHFAVRGLAPDPQSAMMWSTVYEANGARETYGLTSLSPLVRDHLAVALSPEAAARARAEAAQFAKIAMSAFNQTAQPGDGDERADGVIAVPTVGPGDDTQKRRPRPTPGSGNNPNSR